MAVGNAFVLSYYEHGLCQWSLQGYGPQCRFDTAQIAGILIWNTEELGRNVPYHSYKEWDKLSAEERYEKRADSASSFCEAYTNWANGSIYGYALTDDENGENDDSCWGFLGYEYFKERVQEEHPELFDGDSLKETVKLTGDAAWTLE
jgi:hypothetical protein